MRKHLLVGGLILFAALAGPASSGGRVLGDDSDNLGLSSGWMRFSGEVYIGGERDFELQTRQQGFQNFTCDARTLWKWADLGTGKQGIFAGGYTVPHNCSAVVRYRVNDAGLRVAVRVVVYYRKGDPVTDTGE
jgi:hypothetical protein